MTPLFFGIGFGIVVGIRGGRVGPVRLLARNRHGRGARLRDSGGARRFDLGALRDRRADDPEDYSGHGAKSWRDYFQVNTDHKGRDQHVATVVFFLLGGLLAMLVRAELAEPGSQYVDPQTYNALFSVHASLMIFLFVIPAFAGLANYVLPLMIARRTWRSCG